MVKFPAAPVDKLFNVAMYSFLFIIAVVALFPILYIVAVSLTPYSEVLKNGGFIVIPKSITFAAYKELLRQNYLMNSFYVTVFITVAGTVLNLLLTSLMAYPLSRRNLPGRSLILMMIVLTLLFSGGIIPTYLVVKGTGLLDTVWAMIIPNAIWSFNVLIMKSFFENLPEEIFESARMDGAKEFRILFNMAVPLSLPVMFTIGLFYLVGHWNEFFQAIMYVTKPQFHPLQVIIRGLLMKSQNMETGSDVDETIPTLTLQMAAVVFATLPIIILYPFIQKHFTKGMIIGAIKG